MDSHCNIHAREEDAANKDLYIRAIIFKDDRYLDALREKFNNYLFRINLYSYIKKSIFFAAMDLKRREQQIREKEGTYLNILDDEFQEEKINMIADDPVDFVEEIYKDKENIDYREIFTDQKMLQAIDSLTDRQKQIIFECIIKGKEEEMVAKELGVSKQAINKIKKTALDKLRRQIGGK